MTDGDDGRSIDLVEGEGAAIVAIARREPGATVPQYPTWTLRDLAEHCGGILSRTTAIVTTRAQERLPVGELPAETDPIEWLQACLDELVSALRASDTATPVWMFLPDQTVGAWERRMSIEIGVHRWDAESAVGTPSPLVAGIAAMGLDEFPDMFLERLGPLPTLELHATDLDRRWAYGPGEPTEHVSATASELYLRLMARPGADLPGAWEQALDAVPDASA